MDDELLSPDELAAYFKVPIDTLRHWRNSDTGPTAYKLGRHIRYRRSEVEAWLESVALVPSNGAA